VARDREDMTAALIVAAGRGTRAGAGGGPAKQYARIGARAVVGEALAAFARHPRVDAVAAVIASGDEVHYRFAIDDLAETERARLTGPVTGGATRQNSVANGLEALVRLRPARVLIHDAARPFVTRDLIDRVIDALGACDGAVPVVAVTDTLKRIDGARVGATVERAGIAAAQTPQGFGFAAILDAHRRAAAQGRSDFTDDAAVGEWAGLGIAAVEGDPGNVKITTAADLARARERAGARTGAARTRVGMGFDVHAFGPGDGVRLCGVAIAHDRGLKGHSDADVALHAVCDALYGAIGAGDIGHHFPPVEARWKGADSALFVGHARAEVAAAGATIVHVDVTIICERPKVGPHRAAMVERLAALLGVDAGSVSVKATTTEGLGFAGRGEGIAAQAVATVATREDRGP